MELSFFWILLPQFGRQVRSLHLSLIGVSESNGLTGRPKKEDIAVPEKDRSGRNCRNIRKLQRLVLETTQKRRSTCLVSEAIRSTFDNQSVLAWIPTDAVMIIAVALL